MKMSFFRRGYKDGVELNFVSSGINVRLAQFQAVVWWKYTPLIEWRSGDGVHGFWDTHRPAVGC